MDGTRKGLKEAPACQCSPGRSARLKTNGQHGPNKGTEAVMNLILVFAMISVFCVALMAAAPEEQLPKPQYDAKGDLLRPADYRDWEFLSAGYGMNYTPAPGGPEVFTNVFVQRWAYDEFLKSGQWAEQSM